MLFSRWKVMTGLVGVTIGGLAAIAGQLPKSATPVAKIESKPVVLEAPQLPPPPVATATASPVKLPMSEPFFQYGFGDTASPGQLPMPEPLPPATAVLPPTAVKAAVDLPDPPPPSVRSELPTLPLPDAKPTLVYPPARKTSDAKTEHAPHRKAPIPPNASVPDLDPPTPQSTLPSLPSVDPLVSPAAPPVVSVRPQPAYLPAQPAYLPPTEAPNSARFPIPAAASASPPTVATPPQVGNYSERPPQPNAVPAGFDPGVPVKPMAPAAAAAPATKFRIVLRVGEGEPSFEVRHGDDLVMKVASEKIDIKSPEKGQGASNVTATGKVRFVGFGAEGTCDSLSFLAGSGEVALGGNVNVKVRDKIGRVESELNADKMQYKLDQTALTGVLKP